MTAFVRKLAMLLRRDRFRSELDEEMDFHRAEAEQNLIASGMAPKAARRAAKRQFGNQARLREESHEAVAFRLESFWQDARYAIRQMRRAPGFTLAVVLTLALGIGANTAIFSVVHATLLRDLPYPDAGKIVRIEDLPLKGTSAEGLTGVPRVFDLQTRSKSFSAIGLMYLDTQTLTDGNRLPEQLEVAAVSAPFWRVLETKPLKGRVFDEREDHANSAPVAVLSFSAWQRLFGGDPGVVGRVVTINRQPTTLIGVMPPSFEMPAQTDLWRPAQLDPAQWSVYRGDGTRWANVFAKIKPGVTETAAAAELRTLASQLAVEHPQTDSDWQFRLIPLREFLHGTVKPALLVLFAASAVLLLIACLNVGNLMLARAVGRQHEVALRQALGASRARVMRQLLTEATMLSVLGGTLGCVAAFALVGFAGPILPIALRAPGGVAIDWPVAAFALAVSLITGALVAVAPAWGACRAGLNESLKSSGGRMTGSSGDSTRSYFIALQVGLSLVLLVSACLLAESLWNLTQTPLGFMPDHVLTFDLKLPWNSEPGSVSRFYDEVQRRIEALPGVTAVGTGVLPTSAINLRVSYDVDWRPRTEHKDAISAQSVVVSGDYLRAMGVPLLAGRPVKPNELTVMVNQEFVRQYLPDRNPLGRHILFSGPQGRAEAREIVGITGDTRGIGGSLARPVQPELYVEALGYQVGRSFVVRSLLPPESLIPAIRDQVRQADPQQAIGEPRTLDAMVQKSVAQPRLNMALLVAFAAIALTLACVGIYGVVAYSVAQRRQEIGVRMALGASRRQISALFLKRTLASALIGLACGGVATLLLTRLLRSQLYGVQPNDPSTFCIAILLLLMPVFAASLRPALKAASVDPMEALRTE
jgi:putative ABC transport system permease protein